MIILGGTYIHHGCISVDCCCLTIYFPLVYFIYALELEGNITAVLSVASYLTELACSIFI